MQNVLAHSRCGLHLQISVGNSDLHTVSVQVHDTSTKKSLVDDANQEYVYMRLN